MKTINLKIDQANYRLASKYLASEILNILEENKEITNIVSNGNICSILQDDLKYTLKRRDNSEIENMYSIGNFDDIELDVDVLQLWTDNKIYFKKNNDVIIILEVEDTENILI